MSITSFGFLVFVTVSLFIYWKLPGKYQWILLLLDSVAFFLLNAATYTIIYLIISIVSVYYASNFFKKTDQIDGLSYEQKTKKKKPVLIFAIVLNAGILVVLKYLNLAIHTINFISGKSFGDVRWLAPLAVSFYTLQMLSYLLDCYWGIAAPDNNIFRLALFSSYFPQMTSGPISRYSDIGNQLFEYHPFEYKRVTSGMKRIAWGLLKKLAISNRLAVIVNNMWADPETYSGAFIWIAALGFVFQLYTDFSGCMDIVLGVSECFGITLPENFRAPMLSKTIQEFWQRWHITLGSWLRDYIMNPLLKSEGMIDLGDKCKKRFGKKTGKKIPVFLSMLALWLLMGLWHGDSWKYILGEGLWFWVVIVFGQLLEPAFKICKTKLHINQEKLYWKVFQVIRTVAIFTFGMLFFRADSLPDAFYRIGKSFDMANGSVFKSFISLFIYNGLGGKIGGAILVSSMIIFLAVDMLSYSGKHDIHGFFERHKVLKWLAYYTVTAIVIMSINIGQQEFLYAQF